MLQRVAEAYVQIVLQVGQHDPDYVDAYYGDPSWRPSGAPRNIADLVADTQSLRAELEIRGAPEAGDELDRLRFEFLDRHLFAVESRLAMLAGRRFRFDEESRRLYDATAPHTSEAEFQAALNVLDLLLPGRGALIDRYAAFRERFVIPASKLDAVFQRAVEICRARTRQGMTLPDEETLTLEYVTGQPWSAYNWYRGGYASLIQVNTDLPLTIDRAIDLTCHEGYPGHHVHHTVLEQTLVRGRGWVEFSVYPLFSPQSLISEGTANFGIDVAFPGDTRLVCEQDELYPLAGLDPGLAADFSAVQHTVDRLAYAGNEAARRYLDGEIDREAAVEWLITWAMMPRDRAVQRTRFFDRYRSYVINYNLGRDLVASYVGRRGGTADRPDVRWREFTRLLSSPHLPSWLA